MSDLQALVDALAAEIGQPVGLDDRRFRALAYSPHLDDVDEVRRTSILHREAPEAVTEWLESLGVAETAEPMRVPSNVELGMEARVCVPVRFQDTMLGYVWLIDEPDAVGVGQLRAAVVCAAELGTELFRSRRLESRQRAREAEVLEELLLGSGDQHDAARQLATLLTVGQYTVLVVQSRLGRAQLDPSLVKVRFGAALERVRHSVPPRQFLMLATHDQAIAVVMVDVVGAERRARALLAATEDQFADLDGVAFSVGTGKTRAAFPELRDCYREAAGAVRVACRVPRCGPIAMWPALGSYRTITRLVGSGDPAPVVPESLAQLLATPEAPTLVTTLETYLDHAGDAQAAASALYVHRSTLYNRLHRIEELTGVDLRSGDDRLELHVGLRLWRMTDPSRDERARDSNTTPVPSVTTPAD